jgi:hypothetical protein
MSFLNVLKCDFGDFDEAMFHDVKRLYESIYNVLGIQRSNLDEIAEVVLSRRMPLRITMCLLDVLKNDFNEVVETMFQGVERQSERNFLHPVQKKKRTKSLK